MKAIWNALLDNEALQAILNRKKGLGNLSLNEEAVLFCAAFYHQPQDILIVKPNLYEAQRLYERMKMMMEDVLLFAVEDSLRVEAIAKSPEMHASQMEVMATLLEDRPHICITHTGGMLRYVTSKKQFQNYSISIKKDEQYAYEDLKKDLFYAGYQHVSRIDQPLCFAARGGIIDVYSMNYEHPIRIEFFDNIIESVRFFDISTQRTIKVIDEAILVPATDFLFSKEEEETILSGIEKDFEVQKKKLSGIYQQKFIETIQEHMDAIKAHANHTSLYPYYAYMKHPVTIQDYLKDPLVVASPIEEIQRQQKHILEENIAYIQEMSQEGFAIPKFNFYCDLEKEMHKHEYLEVHAFMDMHHPIASGILMQTHYDHGLEMIMQEIVKEANKRIVLLCLSKKEIETVTNYLQEHQVVYRILTEETEMTDGINLIEKNMMEGFVCTQERLSVYTSNEIFQVKTRKSRYANKFKEAEVIHDYMELEIGDYVVHHEQGIGKYMGITNRKVDGVHKDFLHIAYKGNDVLLVPLEHFKFVRKFMSKEGTVPKLNKLGSGEWEKTKKKVSEKVAQLADRLIKLYALREEQVGHAFAKDTPYQKEFEDDFPYELTRDQAKAVMEIKKDMEASKPMDRLLCGDVGFGKTEVAVRAAFKAVMDGKQVAFLCPTTILSLQHYKTFVQRCRNFPIRIAVLNRFVTSKDTKKILQDIKEGKIDIIIGTHRLLSKDVQYKDLGLLVIDEEQRFGVEHKEKIKEYRYSIDVLSMSATPIPRTLQMSLVGIRQLSQLETPPLNRMPVQTYVIEKDFRIIKEIIQRELARNGQVFYLYNNVSEIYQVATKLKEALPEVEIGVAHGQMHREEIEDVMLQFTDNKYQILVCTTIIETGIDIPNANTIIIDEADHFGLSQLYQIKGRVGRSDRLAYAYLMYAPQKQLSEVAAKRLKSIKEFTQLGSGYKIAMRDLAIRGAGDMLGAKQAGFIDTVGMDMYIEMLHHAIAERKGEPITEEQPMKKAQAKVDGYIPSSFAPEDYEKITLYQRIEKIKDKKELLSFQEEIEDNYGKLPDSVAMLIEKKRLDIMINEPHLENFMEQDRYVELVFNKEWSMHIDGVKLFEMMTTLSKDAIIRYQNHKITMKIPKRKNWLGLVIEIVDRTKDLKRKEDGK